MTIPSYHQLLSLRLSRRDFFRAAGVIGAAGMVIPAATQALASSSSALSSPAEMTFAEIAKATTETVQIAAGYQEKVLLRWGDPLFKDAPAFDPDQQSAAKQARQFGYNCDFTAFFPLPKEDADERGLLCVNHEYAMAHLMFNHIDPRDVKTISPDQRRTAMEAVGVSVVEIIRKGNEWNYVQESPYNRRITGSTPINISGAAAGHARMRTSYDPEGKRVQGTLSNCAGGVTPWGTYLTAEENFGMSFTGPLKETHPEYQNFTYYSVGQDDRNGWGLSVDRFDIAKEPREANRFGYIVEIDPYDPSSTPIKRTSLGRFEHECASCAVNHDGRVAVYSGDDRMFEYLYRFVSREAYRKGERGLKASVLDEGTLYAARFHADGTMEWVALVYGKGPLTEENGFSSQADVVIECRRAAKLMQATPMDRPEDIEVDPHTGHVYVALANNVKRDAARADAANPRGPNPLGHILMLKPPVRKKGIDHANAVYRWEVLLLSGDPHNPAHHAFYRGQVSEKGWLTSPDNMAIDPFGNLWIATDGQPKTIGFCNSLYAYSFKGKHAGAPQLFLNVPVGAETTGPSFSPDGSTLFLSVQHPGEDSTRDEAGSTWPDFAKGTPPRPSVVTIRHKNGKPVGYA